MQGTSVTVSAAYPQSTLNGTLTWSSLSYTASYKTYVAGRRNLDVYMQCLAHIPMNLVNYPGIVK